MVGLSLQSLAKKWHEHHEKLARLSPSLLVVSRQFDDTWPAPLPLRSLPGLPRKDDNQDLRSSCFLAVNMLLLAMPHP